MSPFALPEVGQLVRVRGRQWVVSDVSTAAPAVDELAAATVPARTLATLTSVSEGYLGEELSVIREVEPGRAVIPAGALPDVPDPSRWDDPQTYRCAGRRGALGSGGPRGRHDAPGVFPSRHSDQGP